MLASGREIDNDLLITLIQLHPEIWDKTIEGYKDRNKTRDAWRYICSKLDLNFETLSDQEKEEFGTHVLKRWTNLRDQWMKWKKRYDSRTKAGGHVRKYIYAEEMRFMEKIMLNRAATEPNENEVVSSPCEVQKENEDHQISNPACGSSAQTSQSGNPSNGKKKKREMDEFEMRILKTLESGDDDNRHLMFFKSILPSIERFTDSQTLDFQMGVLQLIRTIKTNYVNMPPFQINEPPFDAPQSQAVHDASQSQRSLLISPSSPIYNGSRTSFHEENSSDNSVRFESSIKIEL